MTKINKLLLIIIAVLLCTAVFVSCNNIGGGPGNKPDDNGENDTKLPGEEPDSIECDHSNVIIDPAIPPTCESDGLTEGRHCEKCGFVLAEQETVDKIDHSIVHVEEKSPTCYEDGHKAYYYCENCDYSTIEIIPARHNIVYREGVKPTCTTPGYEAYEYCTNCDYSTIVTIDPSHTLNYVDGQAPTCTADGYEDYSYCIYCDYTTYKSLGRSDHTASNQWVCSDEGHWNPCVDCGAECNFSSHLPGPKPTVSTPQKCTVCDYIIANAEGITFINCTMMGSNVYVDVPNSQDSFIWSEIINCVGNKGYGVFLDSALTNSEQGSSVTLNEGDNLFYVHDNASGDVYKVNIYRNKMFTVTFVSLGKVVSTQQVEEGYCATVPALDRQGYVLSDWDADVYSPLSSDITANAIWYPYPSTMYRVEYYFEDFESGEYVLDEGYSYYGYAETDSKVSVTPMEFEYHIFDTARSNSVGFVAPDGSLVLRIYYSLKTYTVTFEGNGGKYVSGELVQKVKYGKAATPPVFEREGYGLCSFGPDIWYVTQDLTVSAKWNAIFRVDGEKITGLTSYGKSLREIVIPRAIDGIDITTLGGTAFYQCTNLIRVGFADDSVVSTIGNYTFMDCYNLVQVELPKSVTSIGINAFIFCYKLFEVYNYSDFELIPGEDDLESNQENGFLELYAKHVYTSPDIPAKVYETEDGFGLYQDGDELILLYYAGDEQNVVLPSGVTTVYTYAFCSGDMRSIHIGEGVTTIEDNAFDGCVYLENISIPSSLENYGDQFSHFLDRLTGTRYDNGYYLGNANDPYIIFFRIADAEKSTCIIHEDTRFIGDMAFRTGDDISKVESLIIPEGVVYMGPTALGGCNYLKTISLPSTLRYIGHGCFGATALENVVIKDGLEYIGEGAFSSCDQIKRLSIPAGATVDGYLFISSGGESLEYISMPAHAMLGHAIDFVKEIVIVDGEELPLQAFHSAKELISITLPDGMKIVSEEAFHYCRKLERVSLPDSIVEIGMYAFRYCEALKEISLPEGLEVIGRCAFECSGIQGELVIPSSVKRIENPFTGCDNLTGIRFISTTGWVYYSGDDAWPSHPIDVSDPKVNLDNMIRNYSQTEYWLKEESK